MAGERAVVDAGTDPSGTCTTCGHPAAPHPYRHPVTRGPGDLRGRQERPLVVPEDHAAALAVVTDWAEQYLASGGVSTAGQLELVGMVAAAIADGRAQALDGVRAHLAELEERNPGGVRARELRRALEGVQ